MKQTKKKFLSLVTPSSRLGIGVAAWLLGFTTSSRSARESMTTARHQARKRRLKRLVQPQNSGAASVEHPVGKFAFVSPAPTQGDFSRGLELPDPPALSFS